MHKVLIAANTSWYIYNFRSNLIERLITSDFDVVVSAPVDDYSKKFDKSSARFVPVRWNNRSLSPLNGMKTILEIRSLLKHENPKIILTFTPKINIFFLLACFGLNTKVITNISGLGSGFLKGGLLKFLMRGLYTVALKRASLVFFQNKDDHVYFLDSKIIPVSKTQLLPGSGVDLEKFKPAGKKNVNSTPKKTCFLLATRLLKDKGVIEFIEAVKIVLNTKASVEFILLGPLDPNNPSGISEHMLTMWVNEGLINYHGMTDDVRPYIEIADCVVLPSYREGTPRILLEAAAMSKPVITTDVPGCRSTVENGVTGFLCEVMNAADLAEKMLIFYDMNENERSLMGASGRARVEKLFDELIVIDKYIDAIHLHI